MRNNSKYDFYKNKDSGAHDDGFCCSNQFLTVLCLNFIKKICNGNFDKMKHIQNRKMFGTKK